MIYNYEVLGEKRIDFQGDYIILNKQELYIKSIAIQRKFKYCTFLRKVDPVHGECTYLCISCKDLVSNAIRIRHTDFGYVIVNVNSVIRDLYIEKSCNVILHIDEVTTEYTIFRLELK